MTFVKNYDKEKDDLKDLNLLDSDSNTTVFCKQEYVKNIRDTDEVMGVNTNRNGCLDSIQKYKIPHLEEHWFN